jgi:twitching motility two-component system response regulator PilH
MISLQGSESVARKVLVVDDEEDIVAYLMAVLEDNGFKAVGESDAATALEVIHRERPDLILLDIMMPGQSGLSLYRAIRKDPATAEIPVFIITGYSREDNFVKLVGTLEDEKPPLPEGYLEKPISVPRFLQSLRELFEKQRGRGRHG